MLRYKPHLCDVALLLCGLHCWPERSKKVHCRIPLHCAPTNKLDRVGVSRSKGTDSMTQYVAVLVYWILATGDITDRVFVDAP